MDLFISGDEGRLFFGDKNGEISPCELWLDTELKVNLAGTVTSVGTAVTGAGTAFLTDFAVGDYIYFGTVTPQVGKVVAIASNTALTLEAAITAPALTTYKKFTTIYLGQSTSVSVKKSLKKSDIKHSQQGDSRADAVVTGYEMSIEMEMTEATASRMERVFQGFKAHRDVNGNIEGYSWGFPIGQKDSEIATQLTLIKVTDNGTASILPEDRVDFFKVAPGAEMEAKFDASTQRTVKQMFTAYRDTTKKIGGVPQFYASGTVTFDP